MFMSGIKRSAVLYGIPEASTTFEISLDENVWIWNDLKWQILLEFQTSHRGGVDSNGIAK